MRIALVSCEYDGTVYAGGIGTYMRNAAVMLAARGHDVEVFAGGDGDIHYTETNGVRVNLVKTPRDDFADAVAPLFLERHTALAFDVIEGPEFLAETSGVSKVAPNVPLVLKLHTPSALVSIINRPFIPLINKVRFMTGGLVRGRIAKPFWHYQPERDYERDNLGQACEVTSPCHAMVEALADIWRLSRDEVSIIPNVFVPPPALLQVPINTNTNVVTFVGRMELRKGILDLADAIPLVLRSFPSARFRLVGRSLGHPFKKVEIGTEVRARLQNYPDNVEFLGGVPYDQIPQHFAGADICVLPSIWENFPNVCLEAMAAGRGVIGSSAGGMSEIITHGVTGLTTPPRDPRRLAGSILELLRDPQRRMSMGAAARAHVTSAYSPAAIAPLQEASYRRAIVKSRLFRGRPTGSLPDGI